MVLIACLTVIRSVIPSTIFLSTQSDLVKEGITQELAKRICTKKGLWLTRLSPDSIARLHFADLTGTYGYEQQGYDIVELSAIFASLPEKFESDGKGDKRLWKEKLLNKLKTMYAQLYNQKLESYSRKGV